MNRKTCQRNFHLLIFLFVTTAIMAQTTNPPGSQPQVVTAFAVLIKAVESRNATAGQELSLRTISDVAVNGKVIIPRESNLVGHVTAAATKGKDEPQSILSIVIDKAIRNDGVEIPLQAIIAAVAAPQNKSLTSDPTYGMMHSNEPKMTDVGPGSTSSATKAGSNSAVATAGLKGGMDEALSLNENSQGAVGYEGISISWRLSAPPPVTVFSSKSKNVKLEAGTQVLLRMAAPQSAR